MGHSVNVKCHSSSFFLKRLSAQLSLFGVTHFSVDISLSKRGILAELICITLSKNGTPKTSESQDNLD